MAWWDEWIRLPSWFGGFVPRDDSDTSQGAFLRQLAAIRDAHIGNAPPRVSELPISTPLTPQPPLRPPDVPRPVAPAASVLDPFVFGPSSALPKPAPRPARPAPRRRRRPAPKRPPARPRWTRPAPGAPRAPTPKRVEPPVRVPTPAPPRPAPPVKRPSPTVTPNIPGLPADLPPFTINPIEWILREWELYTTPGRHDSPPQRHGRGGKRNRPVKFPRLPSPVIPVPGSIPVELPTGVPSGRPASSPIFRPRGVPAPVVGDPFVVAAPSPTPRYVPRGTPAQPRRLPLAPPRFNPARVPRSTPFDRPRTQPRPAQVSNPALGTPLQPQRLGQTKAEPSNDPCAVRARDARRKQRRRRKECRRFVTKEIRVCAEKE